MKASTARKLKQMLVIVSGIAPVKPNAENLAREIGASKNNIPYYLLYLEKAGMIGQLRDDIEYGHDIILPLWHFGLTY